MLRNICIALALLPAAPAFCQTVKTYGDSLADDLRSAYPALSAIEIQATAKDGTPIRITRGSLPSDPAASLPLNNSMGETIGTITMAFANKRHVPAATIAYAASRKIYIANNLIEPDPFVAGFQRSKVAQAIVDRMMARNPDLVTLGLHIGPSGADNTILASNFGRIGKAGDKDDARVIDKGETIKEVTNGGKRIAVALPLLDRAGRVIGALSTSFLIKAGDADAAAARAIVVRDAMARQIISLAQLRR